MTILTPYVGQIIAIMREMKKRLGAVNTFESDLDQEELLRDEEAGTTGTEDIAVYDGQKSVKSIRCASINK